jgi:hypothetical protein
LEKHHVVGRIGKDKDNPENLIAICHDCHWQWHNYPTREMEQALYRIMKSRYGDLFPIRVNGKPYLTKWIVRAQESEGAHEDTNPTENDALRG